MSFSTYYKHLGCINHCGKNQLEEKRADAERTLDLIKQELVMLACATQPANGTIDLGSGPEPWIDYMASRVRELLSELSDVCYDLILYDQAIEVQQSHPENITDDNDTVDETWGQELI